MKAMGQVEALQWEHTYGITIETLDNPGWRVQIDLTDTDLEHTPFDEIKDLERAENWVHCWVEDGKFHGAAGPFMLSTLLGLFNEWASGRAHEP
jgi:hypothetical protein